MRASFFAPALREEPLLHCRNVMRSWGVLILYSCQQDQGDRSILLATGGEKGKGRRAPCGGRGEAPPAGGGASYRLRGPLRPSSPAGLPSRGRSSPISDLRLETRPRIGQLPKPPLPGKRPRLSQEQPPWTSADPGTWGRGRLEDLVRRLVSVPSTGWQQANLVLLAIVAFFVTD